jgi:hypothetical protein
MGVEKKPHKSGKWKDALLRTSLPLEYLVAEKLCELGFFISGEYAYIRPTDKSPNAEFSVDIHSFKLFPSEEDVWANVHLLVECKYSYPGIKWLFSPQPSESLVIIGFIHVAQELCTRRIEKDIFYEFERDLPFCFKGVEIHNGDANSVSIDHGLFQLRYAIPGLAAGIRLAQLREWNDEDLHIGMICPILVTTADLYVIKEGVSLDDFQKADKIEGIARAVDSLMVYKEAGPSLSKYIEETSQSLLSRKDFCDRLSDFAPILKALGTEDYLIDKKTNFADSFEMVSDRILIVNYNALTTTLGSILNAIATQSPKVKQIAKLKKDMKKRRARIEACVSKIGT